MNRISTAQSLLIILFCCVSLITAHAQPQPTEGIIHFTRTSRWTKIQSALTFLSKQEKEKMAYMYEGRDEWKENVMLYFNEKGTKYVQGEDRANNGYSWRNETFFYVRNFETNRETDAFEILGKTYIIDDTLSKPNWKILNDLKDVAGHICMKAMVEDTIKKQKIVAWFAQDFIHPGGPERYFGLPGMILELDINNGAVVIAADKIEAKKLTNEMELPKKLKGKTLTESAYRQMIYKLVQERIKAEQNPFWDIRY
ncbi:MAG: GLPGLI family protein [Spirosomataceae bacterium]